LNLYVALLQENYSEALPTPAMLNKAVLNYSEALPTPTRLNKAVLRWEKKRKWSKQVCSSVLFLVGGDTRIIVVYVVLFVHVWGVTCIMVVCGITCMRCYLYDQVRKNV